MGETKVIDAAYVAALERRIDALEKRVRELESRTVPLQVYGKQVVSEPDPMICITMLAQS